METLSRSDSFHEKKNKLMFQIQNPCQSFEVQFEINETENVNR